MKMMKILLGLLVYSSIAYSQETHENSYSTSLDFAQVEYVSALQIEDGSWCFKTSVKHNDKGWEHYADEWKVVGINGKDIATRPLTHPHVNEQPFTRRLCNIHIPKELTKVIVKAKCNKHGFGGKSIVVDLNKEQTSAYSVQKYDFD